ncbi:MAG: DUF1573 domain-containing protein [Phycisphaerales bacterium]
MILVTVVAILASAAFQQDPLIETSEMRAWLKAREQTIRHSQLGKGSPRSAVIGVLVVTSCLCLGCGRRDAATPTQQRHNFGEVDVSEGPQVLSWEFDVPNHSSHDMVRTEIVSSCGCLRAELSTDVIPTGDIGVLRVSINVLDAGRHAQYVSVFFVNHKRMDFYLDVTGIDKVGLFASRSAVHLDSPLAFEVDVTQTAPDPTSQVLYVKSPVGATMSLDDWFIVEPASTQEELGRSGRARFRVTIDLAGYNGEFPVEVVLVDAFGSECTILALRDKDT